MKKEIPIFFAVNEKYVPYLAVAIRSLIDNASKENKYKVFVIQRDICKEDIEEISALANEYCDIQFIEIKEGLDTITDRAENRFRFDYFTLTIYFRLFIPEMFTEYDKGIYIDSDVIVRSDIAELYNTELGDNLIGGCADHSIEHVPPLVEYIEEAVGINIKEYINSGVLLMNLKLMREKGFTENFLRLLNEYHFYSVAPDQDYINAMCNGKILYLDEVWDAMPNDIRKVIENPKIVHYNLFRKPWWYDNIKYSEYFWEYAKKTPYYEKILKGKNEYSADAVEADELCLRELIEKAQSALEYENTFKKIYEKGEKIRI